MRKLSIFLIMMMVLVLIASFYMNIALAQEPASSGPSLGFTFAVGEDNLFLVENGKAFVAIGGGIDLIKYTHPMSWGGNLTLYGHANIAPQVTGPDSGDLYLGAGVNLDLLQLMTGTSVEIIPSNLRILIGPTAGYDAGSGKPAGGLLINLSYTF